MIDQDKWNKTKRSNSMMETDCIDEIHCIDDWNKMDKNCIAAAAVDTQDTDVLNIDKDSGNNLGKDIAQVVRDGLLQVSLKLPFCFLLSQV